jgi:two-component sensor histidine kinase
MQPDIRTEPHEASILAGLDKCVAARDTADRKRDEQALALLVSELNHRIRNILAMVQAIVHQTQSTSIEEYRAKLIGRISGLASVHELVGLAEGQSIRLSELLRRTLDPYGVPHRFELTGPDVDLEAKSSLALHLVLHELATNASKHGALSSPVGWVKIKWHLVHVAGGGLMLAIVWTEHGGPEVKTPEHEGFGSRLITRALATQGRVELSFRPEGVACRVLVTIGKPLSTFCNSN